MNPQPKMMVNFKCSKYIRVKRFFKPKKKIWDKQTKNQTAVVIIPMKTEKGNSINKKQLQIW